jgi:hypothetical protein
MNFLQIAQEISDAQDGNDITTLEGTYSGLGQETRRLKANINKAYNRVKLALGIKNESAEMTGSITTVAGQESYAFPTGMLTVQQVRYVNDLPMRIMQWDDYERQKSDFLLEYVPINSSPYLCAIYQRKIWLFPQPDRSYTLSVRGLKTLTELSLDADVPDMPEEFHRVVKEFALYYEMKYENNPQAGVLIVGEGGKMSGQGGQAADAVDMFELVKKTYRQHYETPPRMKSIHETYVRERWRYGLL